MDDTARWEIPVYDAVLLRPRVLLVAVADTRVVLVPPPGEGVVVPTHSVRPLVEALTAANSVALDRSGGRPVP